MNVLRGVLGIFVLGLLWVGCSNSEDERMRELRSETRQRLEGVIERVDRSMEHMRTDLTSAGEKTKEDLESKLGKLQEARDDLTEQLNKVNAVTAADWSDFKKDVDDTIEDVNKTFIDVEMADEVKK